MSESNETVVKKEKSTNTATKKEQTIKKEQNQGDQTLIYCGPTIQGELQQYAIFKEGIPTHIEPRIKDCPSIKGLFVSPEKLAIARTRLQTKGTRENQLFDQIVKYLKGA